MTTYFGQKKTPTSRDGNWWGNAEGDAGNETQKETGDPLARVN